jgi:hypothetical protein
VCVKRKKRFNHRRKKKKKIYQNRKILSKKNFLGGKYQNMQEGEEKK